MMKELKSAAAEDLSAGRLEVSKASLAEAGKRKRGNAAHHGADVNTPQAADQDHAGGRNPSFRRRTGNAAMDRVDGGRAKMARPKGGNKDPGPATKTSSALDALRRKRGASLTELQEITGWQAHSVRGFLSGTVKKKLGFMLTSEVGKDGVRRYRINDAAGAG